MSGKSSDKASTMFGNDRQQREMARAKLAEEINNQHQEYPNDKIAGRTTQEDQRSSEFSEENPGQR
jgi:hypothetical protein